MVCATQSPAMSSRGQKARAARWLVTLLLALGPSLLDGSNPAPPWTPASEIDLGDRRILVAGKTCDQVEEFPSIRWKESARSAPTTILLSGSRYFWIHGKTMETGHYTCVPHKRGQRTVVDSTKGY